MNPKALIPLIAGLVIGGIALKLGADTIRKARGAQAVPMSSVIVAATPIGRGQRISEEMVTTLTVPTARVPEGAFVELEAVIGRVAATSRVAGDLLIENSLAPEGQMPGMIVPSGFRAVSVKIDESSGVNFHLEPGSRVDVIGSFRERVEGKQVTLAKTVLEDVQVGAVGDRLSVVEDGEEGGSARPVRAVTLFVKPQDMTKLHLADSKGKIRLAMRANDGDNSSVGDDLLDGPSVVFGERNNEPAEETEDGGGVLDLLNNFFNREATAEPAPIIVEAKPQPKPAPEPKKPVYVFTMKVRNGDRINVYGFEKIDSESPVLLDSYPVNSPRNVDDALAADKAPALASVVPAPRQPGTATPPTAWSAPQTRTATTPNRNTAEDEHNDDDDADDDADADIADTPTFSTDTPR